MVRATGMEASISDRVQSALSQQQVEEWFRGTAEVGVALPSKGKLAVKDPQQPRGDIAGAKHQQEAAAAVC